MRFFNMRGVNLPSGAKRQADVGLVWREVHNGAGGFTVTLRRMTTVRVSAAANVTVTIDGVLAMTLRSGEVERFNMGVGTAGDNTVSVVLTIGAGDARVQVAENDDPGRRNP
jgi:hypothetical protein